MLAALAARVAREPQVVAVAPYVEERVLLAHGTRVSGARVRGVRFRESGAPT